ncbi:MAG: hypothetical protein LAT60_12140 [Glycocaulis sp.]|nr:hypothetical protein [Glycocaulis sp.]MCH8522679.1 hypothetical protein [Glycocaulis sp.]
MPAEAALRAGAFGAGAGLRRGSAVPSAVRGAGPEGRAAGRGADAGCGRGAGDGWAAAGRGAAAAAGAAGAVWGPVVRFPNIAVMPP